MPIEELKNTFENKIINKLNLIYLLESKNTNPYNLK